MGHKISVLNLVKVIESLDYVKKTNVEVINPLTVRFNLETPFVALISFLADSFSSIICDSNKGKSGFGTNAAIGSGPWEFV